MFLHVSVILSTGGHAWLLLGGACVVARWGVRGCSGVHGCSGGGYVWLLGGHVWLLGGHVWLLLGGGCAWLLWGVCVVDPGGRGHAWLLPGGGGHAWLLRGVWLLRGGMCGCSRGVHGCSQGGMHGCSGACVGYDEIRRYDQ